MASSPVLWTVGHSNHELEALMSLVEQAQIDYVVDVRSYPYSRFAAHFNREELEAEILRRGMRYLFLGESLGGRPARDDHYDLEGHALYGPMAEAPAFGVAIDRLLDGARGHRLALLCSCGRPDDCHRRLLVGKVLCERGAELRHILPDGRVEHESTVDLRAQDNQHSLFGDDEKPWRSAQSVSHKRRLSTSSSG
jgi:uncharacterized protein (DUF488 family)